MASIGIIGIGALASNVIKGLLKNDNAVTLYLSPRGEQLSQSLAAHPQCTRLASNQEVIDRADIIILAVRPENLRDIVRDTTFPKNKKVISLLAGIALPTLKMLLNCDTVYRVMLTNAAEINHAMISLFPADSTIEKMMAPLGNTLVFDNENDFELSTVGVCMNGWFYFLLQAMQAWLTERGMSSEQAKALMIHCLKDISAYADHSALSFGQIGEAIATPGTHTDAGLHMLNRYNAHSAWDAACEVVYNRLVNATAQPLS
ncbi:NAD(P)-binding domain-containing protein [Chimaeribacter arupi]|uniref:NAD(P)-binding domain-containing protein n=1 Tax=Chimaeribacter arupi TaxID=2060066 RepID=UPI000C7A66C2|nr:NAD(P)-binding domain-containing protein [Chimaeribacter arupi]PLR30698.1 pyrroline-5-carboxylate reductase [Chimaeribacter arupi]